MSKGAANKKHLFVEKKKSWLDVDTGRKGVFTGKEEEAFNLSGWAGGSGACAPTARKIHNCGLFIATKKGMETGKKAEHSEQKRG